MEKKKNNKLQKYIRNKYTLYKRKPKTFCRNTYWLNNIIYICYNNNYKLL